MRSTTGTCLLWIIVSACGGDGDGVPDAAALDGAPPDIDGAGTSPIASLVFPAVDSTLPHGNDYPIIVAGAHSGGIDRIDVVIDDVVIAGGPGVPMLWRSGATGVETGAASAQVITATGSFEFVVPGRLTQKVIGLGDTDTGGVVGDIDVGFYFTPISFNLVGTSAGIRDYAAGDVFRLDVTATTIVWRHNGATLASAPRGNRDLHVEAWLPGHGAAIASPQIALGTAPSEPVIWVDHVDTSDGLAFWTEWNSTTREDGDVTIVSRATATGGGSADSAPRIIAVDNTPPTCALVSPTPGVVSGTIVIEGQGHDANLALIAFFIDGVLHSQHDGQAQASSPWDTTTVVDGSHTVEVRAYDSANHAITCPADVTVAN